MNRNRTTTKNILQIAIELDIKVLVIQELWVIVRDSNNRKYRSIIYSSYY
jgi:hypothetical protein